MTCRPGILTLFLGLAIITTTAPSLAEAQSFLGVRWEVEAHGSVGIESTPTDGTGGLPPPGAGFTTLSMLPSRRASSWYFGDGAVLMNQILASFPGGSPFTPTGRINPLDPVLQAVGATRFNGGSFGFRVGAAITPRFGAEFTLDAPLATLELSEQFLSGLESSRTSFIRAWDQNTGLILTGGNFIFTQPSVTSTTTIDDDHGRQLFMTGALTFNLMTQGRFIPYAAVGAGVVSNTGGSPGVTLVGNYRFQSLNQLALLSFPVNETDTVVIRMTPANSHPFVTVVGGGVRIQGSPRWGIRGDVRAYISSNTVDVVVDATPQVAMSTPAGAISSTLTPSIQFSNTTFATSTLSGPAISEFTTFSSSGTAVHVSLSAGYYIRF
jgi:hypothetical protein